MSRNRPGTERSLFATTFTIGMVLMVGSAGLVLASHGFHASFDPVEGNEWWVEVYVDANEPLAGVDARDDGGAWVELKKQDWGSWAKSFHVESGSIVEFRARGTSGEEVISQGYHWPSAQPAEQQATDDRLDAATYVSPGNGDHERLEDIAFDADGNAYVPLNSRPDDFTTNDALIMQYHPDGTEGWSTWLRGSQGDAAYSVALDADGNVYVGGVTGSADFPADGWQTTHGGGLDAWVAKLDPQGQVLWTTLIGGAENELLRGITVDSSGHVFATGLTNSCDFPTVNAAQEAAADCSFVVDAFVTRLAPDGQNAVFSTYLSGESSDVAEDIDIAPNGHAHVSGHTESPDFPTTLGAAQPTYQGHGDGFYAVYAPDGSLHYATYLGGNERDQARGIASDGAGGAYLTGLTHSTDHPSTPDAVQPNHNGDQDCSRVTSGGPDPETVPVPCADIFVTHFDTQGDITYSTFYGDEGTETGTGIALGADGRLHVTGETDGPLPGEAAPIGPGGGFHDAFLLTIAESRTEVERVFRLGGSDSDFGTQTGVAPDGSVWLGAWTQSSDMATTAGAAQRSLDGEEDGYLARFDASQGQAVFDHTGGNEWWVQVHVTEAAPSRVQAQDTNGPWKELELRDWGDWAASFHIEPGHEVRFRAMLDGTWQTSCWFTHPGGDTPSGGETCRTGDDGGTTPPPSDGFDADFSTPGGNEWWVEVYVDANEPLAGVDARDDGGAWIALDKKDWGAWAKSFHVEDGSLMDFRATSQDGDVDISGEYRWPSGDKASSEPDEGDGGGETSTDSLDAAFAPKAGNEWWVETIIVANDTVTAAEARVGNGAWHELTKRDWGTWAASFHAPAGSEVTFRAFDAEGDSSESVAFVWPEAVPAGAEGDPWPQEGSYVHYRFSESSPGGARDANVTYVYHEDRWHAFCKGTETFRDDGHAFEVYVLEQPPLGPTDTQVGERVFVESGGCGNTADEVVVQERQTEPVHVNGDDATAETWYGILDEEQTEYEAEWDRETGLVTDWDFSGRSSDDGNLIDTDAPIG